VTVPAEQRDETPESPSRRRGGDSGVDNLSDIEGGAMRHAPFNTPCYTVFEKVPSAAGPLRELLEATALTTMATLAVAAARAVDTIDAIASGGGAWPFAGSGTSMHSLQPPGITWEGEAERSALPQTTLRCITDLCVLAAKRPELNPSVRRAIAQMNASLG
jgi:hypothetical protein